MIEDNIMSVIGLHLYNITPYYQISLAHIPVSVISRILPVEVCHRFIFVAGDSSVWPELQVEDAGPRGGGLLTDPGEARGGLLYKHSRNYPFHSLIRSMTLFLPFSSWLYGPGKPKRLEMVLPVLN